MRAARGSRSVAASDRLRVLSSARRPRERTNPYITLLGQSLQQHEVDVIPWTWATALLGRFDVFHAHWPEFLIRPKAGFERSALRLMFRVFIARLARNNIPVVQTMHNLAPHEATPTSEQRVLRELDARVSARVVLNTCDLAASAMPVVHIPHGHYRDWYKPVPTDVVVLGRIASFGIMRPYKGTEALLNAFSSIEDSTLSLAIAGRTVDSHYSEQLRELAQADQRVTFIDRHLDDRELTRHIRRSELIALPYKNMHNSGAALLALSLARPVLVPRTPTTLELATEVGDDWVITFEGELTGDTLTEALSRIARDSPGPRFMGRDWVDVSAAHAKLYRSITRSAKDTGQ